MKKLHDQMREIVAQNLNDGYTLDDDGVTLTNGEAMQVVAALEQLTYPPVVRAVLAVLVGVETDYCFVGVDSDGELYSYENQPRPDGSSWGWGGKNEMIARIPIQIVHEYSELLFVYDNGKWTWAHKPS